MLKRHGKHRVLNGNVIFLGSGGLNMSTWPDPQLSSYTRAEEH